MRLNSQADSGASQKSGGWRVAIGLLASVACVGALVRLIDWRETMSALSGVKGGWIALAALLLIGCYVAFAFRWWVLLECDPALPPRRLFAVLMMGLALNAILPLRPGEALRAYLVGQVYGGGTSRALGSIVLERILDVASVLLMGALAAALVPLPDSIRRALLTMSLLVSGAVAMVLFIAVFSEPLTAILVRVTAASGRSWTRFGARQLAAFIKALIVGGSPVHLLVAAAIGMIGWAFDGAAMIACGMALEIPSPVVGGLLMAALTNLGGIVPSSPASIGVYHALAVLALSATGTSQELALAAALISHALVFVIHVGFGALAFGGLTRAVRASIKAKQWEKPMERGARGS